MSIKTMPDDHPKWPKISKTAVLLVNLGTPEGTDLVSMKKYLKEFLSDARVIEAPKLLWWFILNFIILKTRPKKSGEAYKKIWLKKGSDGSPLRKYTRLQAKKLNHGLMAR